MHLMALNDENLLSYNAIGQKSNTGLIGLKTKVSGGLHFLLKALENNLCLLQILEVNHIPWSYPPSSIFKTSNGRSSLLTLHLFFHLFLTLAGKCSPTLSGHVIILGPPG